MNNNICNIERKNSNYFKILKMKNKNLTNCVFVVLIFFFFYSQLKSLVINIDCQIGNKFERTNPLEHQSINQNR